MADENVVKLIIGNGEELEEENMQLACGVLGKYRPVAFCFPEFFMRQPLTYILSVLKASGNIASIELWLNFRDKE